MQMGWHAAELTNWGQGPILMDSIRIRDVDGATVESTRMHVMTASTRSARQIVAPLGASQLPQALVVTGSREHQMIRRIAASTCRLKDCRNRK